MKTTTIKHTNTMKKLPFLALAALPLVLTAANPAETEETGGFLTVWPANHGTFTFVNAQNAVADDVIAKPINAIKDDFHIDIRSVKGDFPEIRQIPARLAEMKSLGAIWIVNDPALPMMLAAAENGWGILNVAPFITDKPDAKKLDQRLLKMFNRTFATIHGATDSPMMPQCVMKPAHGLADIDALICRNFSPEAYSKVSSYLQKCGYLTSHSGTYYDACEEGWAPLPTNAVQKAIWDKVHAMPTAPIQLKKKAKK